MKVSAGIHDQKKKYRLDIDGLRAVAVVSVVLFHLDFPWVSRGYLGVDIFFVISGYLITDIIFRRCSERSFCFVEFYERRIRRLLPALTMVICFTTAVSALLFTPEYLKTYGKALASTFLLVSNWHFYQGTGYFTEPAETQPLLHTWSLSVEEQFYLMFPLVVWGLVRTFGPTNSKRVLFTLFLASFAYAAHLYLTEQSDLAFFSTFTRIWELGAGAVIALQIVPQVSSARSTKWVRCIALAMMVFPIVSDSISNEFSPFLAALPVVGCALLIACKPGKSFDPVYWFLCLPPIRYLGRISYSLYLWHWPIFVFLSMYFFAGTKDGYFAVVALSISLCCAMGSYHWIENRYRNSPGVPVNRERPVSRVAFLAAATVSSFFIVLGTTIWLTDGLQKDNQAIVGIEKLGDPNCKVLPDVGYPEKIRTRHCIPVHGQPSRPSRTLVWGDSQLRAIVPALTKIAETHRLHIDLYYTDSCPPLFGVWKKRDNRYKLCETYKDQILNKMLSPDIDTVIIASIWHSDFTNPSGPFQLIDEEKWKNKSKSSNHVFRDGLARTLEKLRGKKVFLLEQPPRPKIDPRIAWLSAKKNSGVVPHKYRLTRGEHLRVRKSSNAFLHKTAAIHNATVISLTDILCDRIWCPIVDDHGLPMYADPVHLNYIGAQKLIPRLERIIFGDRSVSNAKREDKKNKSVGKY